MRTCTADPAVIRMVTTDLNMQPPCCTPTHSPCHPAWLPAELDQPLAEDGSTDSGDRITQMTREMAKDVFLMSQNLQRRGHLLVCGPQCAAVVGGLGTVGNHTAS